MGPQKLEDGAKVAAASLLFFLVAPLSKAVNEALNLQKERLNTTPLWSRALQALEGGGRGKNTASVPAVRTQLTLER